jgi:hypothetical protein
MRPAAADRQCGGLSRSSSALRQLRRCPDLQLHLGLPLAVARPSAGVSHAGLVAFQITK